MLCRVFTLGIRIYLSYPETECTSFHTHHTHLLAPTRTVVAQSHARLGTPTMSCQKWLLLLLLLLLLLVLSTFCVSAPPLPSAPSGPPGRPYL
jgi:hypothetical protein